VNRGYTVTTGVWARGILQHEYGVDLKRITWLLSGDEHVAEYRPPANVVPMAAGRTLDELLASGEIPAAIGLKDVSGPNIAPLIPDAVQAGLNLVARTGVFPINHTVVVRDDVLEAHPELAQDIFDAFTEAKRLYVEQLKEATQSELTGPDRTYAQVMALIGDPLPYGIEPNRATLETLMQYAEEQGILPRSLPIEELFATVKS